MRRQRVYSMSNVKESSDETKLEKLRLACRRVEPVHYENRIGLYLDGKKISDVSNRYQLVQNAELLQPLVDKYGVNALSDIRFNAKGMMASFDTGKSVTIGGNEMIERVIVVNSFDKTKRWQVLKGALRIVCSNGLLSGITNTQWASRHRGGVDINYAVNHILNQPSTHLDQWSKWASISMDAEKLGEFAAKFKAFPYAKDESMLGRFNARIAELAQSKINSRYFDEDNQPNAWGLYNQINWAIDRKLSAPSRFALRNQAQLNAEKYVGELVG